MSRFNLKRSSPKDEFPNLGGNRTLMGRILDLHMYTRQFNRATESGVIFDDIIRPGLEDPGECFFDIYRVNFQTCCFYTFHSTRQFIIE